MTAGEDVVKDLHGRVGKTLEAFRGELMKIRTGRANLGMLEGVKVDYYGTSTPLNGVASLSIADARLIVLKPWDKSMIQAIEKAIREANLGLNPQTDGELVRVPVPALTEERRKEIVKQVKAKGEEFKVAIRNERRDAKEMIEEYQKSGDISEDDAKKALEKVQKETDEGVKRVDELLVAKEKEVLQV
jgi:ribosome recycling factor